MSTVTIKMEGFINKDKYGGKLYFSRSDMSEYGDLLVGPYTLEFEYELPEGWDPTAAQVAALNKQKDALTAEFHRRVAQINDQISKLQALPFNGEVSS